MLRRILVLKRNCQTTGLQRSASVSIERLLEVRRLVGALLPRGARHALPRDCMAFTVAAHHAFEATENAASAAKSVVQSSGRLDRVDIQKVTLRERIVEKLPRQFDVFRHPIKFIAEKLARFLILRTRIRFVLVQLVQRHRSDDNPSLAQRQDFSSPIATIKRFVI